MGGPGFRDSLLCGAPVFEASAFEASCQVGAWVPVWFQMGLCVVCVGGRGSKEVLVVGGDCLVALVVEALVFVRPWYLRPHARCVGGVGVGWGGGVQGWGRCSNCGVWGLSRTRGCML
jgi:hypothetical protein